MNGFVRLLAAGLVALAVAGCGEDSKKDILDKAQGADTRAKLEDALGKPDDVAKLGPLEKWTYNASDGTVTFAIAGDSVTTSVTGDKAAK